MKHIIDIWPTLSDLAADLSKPHSTVSSWVQRGSIPARYDLALIDAARGRGGNLTLQQLAEMRALSPKASSDYGFSENGGAV